MIKFFLIVCIFCPVILLGQTSYNYKNLVLEGGGVRGLAYAGALSVLEEKNVLNGVERVAGSSAGAITGLMLSIGYNTKEIDSIFESLKIQQFNDGKDIFGKIRRVNKEFGLFKGDKFERWLGELIETKTGNVNTTFNDLHQLHLQDNHYKDFYCTGTNISRQQLEIFSWKTRPAMQLKTAVHISSCIPFYFKPVVLDSSGHEIKNKKARAGYHYYVDGGMLCNFPINIFDSVPDGGNPLTGSDVIYNTETLGLKLERASQVKQFEDNETAIAPFQISNLKEYTDAVMNLMMEKLNRNTNDLSNEKDRTIYISYNEMSGRIRKIPEDQRILLYHNGVMAAREFFMQNAVLK